MTLRKPNKKDIIHRMERLAQDQATRNVEYAIDKKNVISVATMLAKTNKTIADAIEKTVNGKIDALRKENNQGMSDIIAIIETHNIKHEADMIRIEPALLAFEKSEQALQGAKTSGRVILWVASFIISVGTAFLIVRNIITSAKFSGLW